VIGQARKAKKNLSIDALKKLVVLIEELKRGPEQPAWPNYGKLHKDEYHCHIKKGRPTYVVCWAVNKKSKFIEVYYAGTHENAPY
jgi:hypothetical protein